MKREELEVLEEISKIENDQRLLLQKPKCVQQELLHIYGQRFLLSKKMLHRNIQEVVRYLPGSFGATALRLSYMALCLDNSVELPLDQYPVLKMLVDWSDFLNSSQANGLTLNQLVFQKQEPTVFSSHQEYTVYLNMIANDLMKWPHTKKAPTEEILSFIHAALPKVLYNVLLPKKLVPFISGQKKNIEVLFKHRSWQHFHRSKPSLGILLKTLLLQLVQRQLTDKQQKKVMELILLYFYIYHHEKKYQATDLFVQGFNKLSQPVRNSLADEFLLFFRILRKVGKVNFVEFLIKKSQWLRQTMSKMDENGVVGYLKDSLTPYNPAGLGTVVQIGPGKTQSRYFEVVQDLSLVYFSVQALSLDITVRLLYLGPVEGKPVSTLLSEQVKTSVDYRSNFMALRRGIYKFQLVNSYSWINGKTVRIEYSVLEPVEIKSNHQNTWSKQYYGSLPTNTICEPYKVQIVYPHKNKTEEQSDGKAAITKNGKFFNVKVIKPKNIYEFETENQEKFVQRCTDISNQNEHLQWTLFGQALNDSKQLGEHILSSKHSQEKSIMKPPKKAQQIDVKFEEDEDDKEQ